MDSALIPVSFDTSFLDNILSAPFNLIVADLMICEVRSGRVTGLYCVGLLLPFGEFIIQGK